MPLKVRFRGVRKLFTSAAVLVALGSCGDDAAPPPAVDASAGDGGASEIAPKLKCEADTAGQLALPGLKLSTLEAVAATQESASQAQNQLAHCLVTGALEGASALAYVFTTPPTELRTSADWDARSALNRFLAGFDFDVDAPKIDASTDKYTESATSFMTPPDNTQLTKFAKKGKLILYHGTADPVFSVNDTLSWYKALAKASSFARLFLVPGMGHCSGGRASLLAG